MVYKPPIESGKYAMDNWFGAGKAKTFNWPGARQWGGPDVNKAGGWMPFSTASHDVSRKSTPGRIFQKSNYSSYRGHKER